MLHEPYPIAYWVLVLVPPTDGSFFPTNGTVTPGGLPERLRAQQVDVCMRWHRVCSEFLKKACLASAPGTTFIGARNGTRTIFHRRRCPLVLVGLAGSTSAWAQSDSPRLSVPADWVKPDDGQTEHIHDSLKVLAELNATPDNAISRHLLERAEAIVVSPSLVKGGFMISAQRGKGIVSLRDRATIRGRRLRSWNLPGEHRLADQLESVTSCCTS